MNYISRIATVLLTLYVILSSCKPTNNSVTPINVFQAGYNVLYGTDTIQQTLDYYLPTNRDAENTPVVILLHGGAWIQGDKSDFSIIPLDTLFTSYGIALVNMNYRLDKKYAYPAPLDDIAAVMELIRQKAVEWRINPNRICLAGRSAGAQLAMLYAYSRNADHRIKAVLECCGPTNFTDNTVVDSSLGVNVTVWLGNYTQHQQLWHDTSPIYYMSGAVPTVILQGLADPLVLPKQAFMLQDSLAAHNMPCKFVGWPNSGHGWNLQLWPSDQDETVLWLKNFL